jgi:hypothetical protein
MCAQADIETFELPFSAPALQVSLHTYRRAVRISHIAALPNLVARTSYLSVIPSSVDPA